MEKNGSWIGVNRSGRLRMKSSEQVVEVGKGRNGGSAGDVRG